MITDLETTPTPARHAPNGRAVRGHLHLTCSRRPDGVMTASRQSFAPPAHLSKCHLDRGVLIANLASPTAGFFDGDTLDVSVVVEEGAALCFTTPAAPRVHPAAGGPGARLRQSFHIGAGALLEVLPEPFIPHAGARCRQETTLHATAGSRLLYLEWITPGRVASGEVHQFDRLEYATDLFIGGRLCGRERYAISPGDESLHALRRLHPAAHFLGFQLLGPAYPDAGTLDALHDANTALGHGPLPGGAMVIRALCADSLAARRLVNNVRQLVWNAWGKPMPSLGRF